MRDALSYVACLLLLSCNRTPGPGDSCKKTDIRCVDGKTELACEDGVFISTPCKGPMGCREDAKRLTCDVTGNADGDPCSKDEEGVAQCIGDKGRITCRDGRYAIDACRGEQGCRGETGVIRCDQSKSQEGDPCHGTTNSCSLDAKSVLTCHDGKFAVAAQCPGAGGCTVASGEVNCDLGKKDEGKTAKSRGR